MVDIKKILKFTKYKGYEDPSLRINIYEDDALVIALKKDLHYNLFNLTFKGNALK